MANKRPKPEEIVTKFRPVAALCGHPTIASATAMCVILRAAETEGKWQDRSVRRAEKPRCGAGIFQSRSPIRPDTCTSLTAKAARGGKRLIDCQNQAILPKSRGLLGEYRVKPSYAAFSTICKRLEPSATALLVTYNAISIDLAILAFGRWRLRSSKGNFNGKG
jgi:hypothetical protein